jgi:hypothetical protein
MKVIKAPNQFDTCDGVGTISIFLAGSIEMGLAEPWQEKLVNYREAEAIAACPLP